MESNWLEYLDLPIGIVRNILSIECVDLGKGETFPFIRDVFTFKACIDWVEEFLVGFEWNFPIIRGKKYLDWAFRFLKPDAINLFQFPRVRLLSSCIWKVDASGFCVYIWMWIRLVYVDWAFLKIAVVF